MHEENYVFDKDLTTETLNIFGYMNMGNGTEDGTDTEDEPKSIEERIEEKIDEFKVVFDMKVIFPIKVFINRFKEGKYDFIIALIALMFVMVFVFGILFHYSYI